MDGGGLWIKKSEISAIHNYGCLFDRVMKTAFTGKKSSKN
jgi:hypothetical protein